MIYKSSSVDGTAYMNFKEATDGLFSTVDHQHLATQLGVSVATIRQARLRPEAKSHRAPPGHWREAVIRIAEAQIMHYRRLIDAMRREIPNSQ
jgi:hypothetical protein